MSSYKVYMTWKTHGIFYVDANNAEEAKIKAENRKCDFVIEDSYSDFWAMDVVKADEDKHASGVSS